MGQRVPSRIMLSVCVLLSFAVSDSSECVNLDDNYLLNVPNDGSTLQVQRTYCVQVDQEDTTMLIVYEGTDGSIESRIEVNDKPDRCVECSECLSPKDSRCQGDGVCACNMRCLRGICSQTVAPLYPGTWYITVVSKPGYSIKVRLFPTWELEEGVVHESSLASSDPYYHDHTRVVEASPWWDFYSVVATDSTVTVTVRNLEDSGVKRGFVQVVMKSGSHPDAEDNKAVYSTYTRDTVQAHLRHVKVGETVYIGVLGRGNERWIRYNIKTGGFKFAVWYAVLGVISLVMLLGAFVWYLKKRTSHMRTRQSLFYSSAYADNDLDK
eukprot:c7404_g1_i2.p1 GENE.c7404_g1_i2~~c7404_g1_i2.p1  ORF type:complete len:324 (+),score=50.04 c7404_g1_i2:1-972(+)